MLETLRTRGFRSGGKECDSTSSRSSGCDVIDMENPVGEPLFGRVAQESSASLLTKLKRGDSTLRRHKMTWSRLDYLPVALFTQAQFQGLCGESPVDQRRQDARPRIIKVTMMMRGDTNAEISTE